MSMAAFDPQFDVDLAYLPIGSASLLQVIGMDVNVVGTYLLDGLAHAVFGCGGK